MTVLTIEIPDTSTQNISEIIMKEGGSILASSEGDLSREEQLSFNRGLREAKLIETGKMKPLSFDDLWDD